MTTEAIMPTLTHAPRPTATFHLGVTGHRDLSREEHRALAAALTEVLREAAGAVAAAVQREPALFAPNPPRLRCLTSLAAGTDQVAAASALEQGVALHCPLPFPRQRYLEDFPEPAGRQAFLDLLARAEVVFELDGTEAPAAYLAAGRIMLDHSDLLLAFWDGQEARGTGGTAEIVAEATARGVPVLVVDRRSPGTLRWQPPGANPVAPAPASADWRPALHTWVEQTLLPAGDDDGTTFSQVRRHFDQPVPVLPWYGRLTPRLERLLLVGSAKPAQPPEPPAHREPPTSPFDQPYLWADRLAIHYAQLHRSFVMLRYLLILPIALGLCIGFYLPVAGAKAAGFGLQALSLAAILQLSSLNRRRDWLARFTDNRLLAELLRHQRIVGVLGRTVPALRRQAHRPETAVPWVNWVLRATVREAGLPPQCMTAEHLDQVRQQSQRDLAEQIAYHERTAVRTAALSQRLERVGTGLFQLGLFAVLLRALVFLLVDAQGAPASAAQQQLGTLLNILSLALPALAPVFLGLRSQAEYARLAAQSRSMAAELRNLLPALVPALSHHLLCQRLDAAIGIMLGEASDWRLTIKARPLSPN